MKPLKMNYLNRFQRLVKDKKDEWNELRDSLIAIGGNPAVYPSRLEGVLLLSYERLVDMYWDYVHIKALENKSVRHDIEQDIFNYSKGGRGYGPYQSTIANFFMKYADELHISVCHYCESSYVNVYGLRTIYNTFEEFIRKATFEELKFYIRKRDGGTYRETLLNNVYNLRDSKGILKDEFNALFRTTDKSGELWKKLRNHFDLDHFLPKSKCPLVALSLFNFVPSCAVCNEKLKGKKLWGTSSKEELKKMSPTARYYDFDGQIKIRLIPQANDWHTRMKEEEDSVRITFDVQKSPYSGEVDILRLNERYNYHKKIAINLHNKLVDYPESKIAEIANLFDGVKSVDDVRDAIFGIAEERDLMRKMKQDIKDAYNPVKKANI